MNARQIINVHKNLWAVKTRSFRSMRMGSYRFVTQNLSKPTRNTEWIKGDPLHRKLTWVFQGQKTVGCVREYMSNGENILIIEKFNPDRVVHKEVA